MIYVLCENQTEVEDNHRAHPAFTVPGGPHQGDFFFGSKIFQLHSIEGVSFFSAGRPLNRDIINFSS